MKRAVVIVSLALLAASLGGCPERKDMINEVGGAPASEVDNARQRLDAANAKMQGNLDRAAASTVDP
jgi:hypothetical protein